MKSPSFQRTFTRVSKNYNALGEELSTWFSKPTQGKGSLHWMTHKYNRAKLEREFNEMKKENDHTLRHLMQRILKNK